jgi:hypothetical protein
MNHGIRRSHADEGKAIEQEHAEETEDPREKPEELRGTIISTFAPRPAAPRRPEQAPPEFVLRFVPTQSTIFVQTAYQSDTF